MNNPNPQTLAARCAEHAQQHPDHLAVICEGREVTYAELHRRRNQSAHALLADLACAKSRIVLVPVNWRLTSREVDHVLRDSDAGQRATKSLRKVVYGGSIIAPPLPSSVGRPCPGNAVAGAAVVGMPDPRWGQAVKAAVVLHKGQRATLRDLTVFLRGRLADFKISTRYDFVASLPRNPTGKVLRRMLRAET